MLDIDKYKIKDSETGLEGFNESKFGFDIMRNIPAQIEKFFEL